MAETDQAVQEEQDQQTAADGKTQAKNVDYPEAVETAGHGAGGSIDILLEMDVPVTAVIGETEIPIRRLLQLGPGSVLKLDRSVEAPADLYLRDTKFATGSIVVVEDRFAIRINKVLGLTEAGSEQNTA